MKHEFVGLEGQSLSDELSDPPPKLALGLGVLREYDTVVVHLGLFVQGSLPNLDMGRSVPERPNPWLHAVVIGNESRLRPPRGDSSIRTALRRPETSLGLERPSGRPGRRRFEIRSEWILENPDHRHS